MSVPCLAALSAATTTWMSTTWARKDLMTRPLRVAMDIDGVLANFNDSFVALLIEHGATMRPWEDGKDPTFWTWFEMYGATSEQAKAAWKHATDTPRWWGTLGPHRDFTVRTMGALHRLNRDHEVLFISSRPCGRDVTAHWLRRYTSDFCHVMLTPGDKVPALVSFRPDVVVEDKWQTMVSYQNQWEAPALLLLVERAYNQLSVGTTDPTHVTRVPTTLDALQKIEEIVQ